MNRKFFLALAAAAMVFPLAASAKKPPHYYHAAAAQAGQLTSQSVERYVIDTFGEVDGLILADGWFAKFPAHQSAALVSAVKPGDTVAIAGAVVGHQAIEAWTVTNTATQAVVVRTPKVKGAGSRLPKHLRAAALRPLDAQGTVTHLFYGKKGEVKGAHLDSGTTLRLAKHAQWVIGTRLAIGAQVSARGVGTQNDYGRTIEVTQIGFDNAAMISLYAPER